MTRDEVLAVFPGSQDDPEIRSFLAEPISRFGTSELLIRPWKLKKDQVKPTTGGVTQISVLLLDGHVSRFNVGYNGPRHQHVDSFVDAFLVGRNLPQTGVWQGYPGLDDQLKILTCAEFEVRVNAGGEGGNLNYIQVQDLEAEKKLKERRRKAREQASPTPGSQ